jgi:hypothetical protein
MDLNINVCKSQLEALGDNVRLFAGKWRAAGAELD